jgi:hypothetical protein
MRLRIFALTNFVERLGCQQVFFLKSVTNEINSLHSRTVYHFRYLTTNQVDLVLNWENKKD